MFLNMLSDEVDLLKGKKVEHDTKEQPLIEVSNNISDDYVPAMKVSNTSSCKRSCA